MEQGGDPIAVPCAGSVLDHLTHRHLSSSLVIRTDAGSVLDVPDMRLELPLLEVFGRGGALKTSWYGDSLLPLVTSRC
jgi:hypothetical protein